MVGYIHTCLAARILIILLIPLVIHTFWFFPLLYFPSSIKSWFLWLLTYLSANFIFQPLPPSPPLNTSLKKPYTLTSMPASNFPTPATASLSPLYDILDQVSSSVGSRSPEYPPHTQPLPHIYPSLPHTPHTGELALWWMVRNQYFSYIIINFS